MLLSLLRRSSSSSSFSFFSFCSEVQRDMLSVRRLIVEWAPLSSTLTFIGPGRAGPPPIDQSQVTPFILLKSTCAEDLTHRHETECWQATRHWSRLPEPARCRQPVHSPKVDLCGGSHAPSRDWMPTRDMRSFFSHDFTCSLFFFVAPYSSSPGLLLLLLLSRDIVRHISHNISYIVS